MTTSQAAGAGAADTEIADRITNAIIVKNINVRSLSDATGISYPVLLRSLTGHRSLTFREFSKIAGVIGVQPSELLPDTIAGRDTAA